MKLIHSLLGAALVVCAACSQPTPEPEAQAAVSEIALYAIDCGRINVMDADVFADDGSFAGVTRGFTNPCFLIRHPDGDLLWDAGLPDSLAGAAEPTTISGFELLMAQSLSEQLGELDLSPADIEYFSISHSHFDHIGNGSLMAKSTFLVDANERAWMFRDEARADAQTFPLYAELETAKTVELTPGAPHDVFGDGAVMIHPAPGHTPGHRVLLVNLASGPVLLTGDMYHLAESRERRTVPRFNTDRAQTEASFDYVETLASTTGARVVRQHVPDDFDALPPFPEALR